MERVEIILKSGKSVVTECEDIEMEWTKEGALTWMKIENGNPEVAFVDLNSVACVLVGEYRNIGRARKRTADAGAMQAAADAMNRVAMESAT